MDEKDASQCAAQVAAVRWPEDGAHDGFERVAEEVPVALVFNGVSHAVMLATPADLEDFAVGFSLAEDIVRSPSEIYDIVVAEVCNGLEVHLTIAAERMFQLKEKRRSLAGRTGCGLCGTESLAHAVRELPGVASSSTFGAAAVHRAFAELARHQHLHRLTGAVHAAAWADAQGNVALAREDVGRHNALDKLIGALRRQQTAPSSGFIVVTSRASYEMVQKAVSAGVPLLAAISAPTALAVRKAQEAGLTLIGFARQGKHAVYAHPERLSAP